MRIKRLDLLAFGPFTDKSLDLGAAASGFHLIYGPNEAGKSSALRGLKALLYGFPERTSDNFIHPNNQLLVGGCLQLSDGQELSFSRRKKRVSDLLDQEGNILAPSSLSPYLGGIEPEVFAALYGITHAELVRGGEDILAQKGEVGQALFAAGAGLSSLKEVLDGLQAEAEELFKERGTKPEINQLLAEYSRLRKEQKEAALPSRSWNEHQQALREAEQELARLEEERQKLENSQRRLERLRQALPHLVMRRSLLQQLAQFTGVLVLPADFSERRQEVDKELHSAARHHDVCLARARDLEKRRDSISMPQMPLTRASEIEELYQGVDRYRKNQRDREKLAGMRVGFRIEAAELLKQTQPELALENIETLRPFLNRRKAILRLAGQYEALEQRRSLAGKRFSALKHDLAGAEESLASLPESRDLEALRTACRVASQAVGLDADLEERGLDLAELQEACEQGIKRIGLWSGEPAAMNQLHLPLPETIQRFGEEFLALAERERQNDREQETLQRDLAGKKGELEALQLGGEVPTEVDLQQARQLRDQGWQVLRGWLFGEAVEAGPDNQDKGPVAEEYEAKVMTADNLADRLRREADKVQRFAVLSVEIAALQERLDDLQKEAPLLAADRQTLEARWRQEWLESGIEPLGAKEMSAWLNAFEQLRFKAAEIDKMSRELQRRAEQRQKLLAALLAELNKLVNYSGPCLALSPVVQYVETVLAEHDKLEARRQAMLEKKLTLSVEVDKAEEEKRTLALELGQWRRQWEEAVGGWQAGQALAPAEAGDALETLRECFDKLREADTIHKRIQGIERDIQDFRQAVEKVLGQDEELLRLSRDQAVERLMAGLSTARENKALLDKYAGELAEAEEEARQAKDHLAGIKEQRAALLKIAACEEQEMLEAERRSAEYLQLKDKLEAVEKTLIQIAEGLSLEDLEQQAAKVSPEELPGLISTGARKIKAEIEPEIKRLSEMVWEEKKTLSQMDGSSKAAEVAESMQSVLAHIRRLSEQYVRLKSAANILKAQIERYRAVNQDPVLEIASRYFADLTRQSFTGLKTDEDNQGHPVLVGVRAGKSKAPLQVESMSSGTRDQLYLALRLASLQWRLRGGEPMPFIVDDILVNFDDERAAATLQVLAELAQKTQVILFTHHSQIVNAAKQLTNEGLVQVHHL